MLAAATSNNSAGGWEGIAAARTAESAPTVLSGACALLAILVETQTTTQAGSRTDIELTHEKMEELRKQLADAIKAAKDAADSGGFFGFLGDIFGSDIAQIAGAVAAVAATIATGGAAAPLLLVVLAEALEVAAKVGAELGLAPELCVALSIASVGVGLCSGAGTAQALGTAADVGREVKLVATVVQGTASAAGGALHGVSSYYESEQLKRQADATGYQAGSDAASMDIDDAIARLSRALRTGQRETNTISEIITNNADANQALCDRI